MQCCLLTDTDPWRLARGILVILAKRVGGSLGKESSHVWFLNNNLILLMVLICSCHYLCLFSLLHKKLFAGSSRIHIFTFQSCFLKQVYQFYHFENLGGDWGCLVSFGKILDHKKCLGMNCTFHKNGLYHVPISYFIHQ